MLEENNAVSYLYPPEDKGILIIEARKSISPISWIQANKKDFEKALLKFGGILLRNFDIYAVSEFNRFAQEICPYLLNYTYRSTPRTNLGGKIYTATEYPADQYIPLHNENAYSDSWPSKIMFFCVIPAKDGGETPIADSRKIFKRLDTEIINKFIKKGILYVRNYSPGVDLSWQEVFQTSNKLEVEKYCKEHSIEYSWNKKGPELTTKQICQVVLTHPLTKEDVWFNQAHLFHISSLRRDVAQSLLIEFGEENLPRNSYYGDGSPIEEAVLEKIRDVYDKESIIFKWQKGDLMVLDNILMAHGRNPYSGERKIAVAMG
ncbi:MAG: TauD/TfdA family dioxygenase [Proteobacteria bacterium]|nr:TauD/TfdA family dioxygenase [Pseudomonadota bacterium]